MEMKKIFFFGLAALALSGCVTPGEAPKKELTEPEMVQLTDPNPFAPWNIR